MLQRLQTMSLRREMASLPLAASIASSLSGATVCIVIVRGLLSHSGDYLHVIGHFQSMNTNSYPSTNAVLKDPSIIIYDAHEVDEHKRRCAERSLEWKV